MATVDALVIGRKTFETVLTFDAWPYAEKPVFVLSTRPLATAPPGAVVERMSGAPADIVSQLAARGDQAHLRGWRDHHSAVSSGWAHSAAHHHPRSSADRYRDSALWRVARTISLSSTSRRGSTPVASFRANMWLPPNTVCSRRRPMRS